MSHQGYSNYETFAVALWIDNDQGLYTERRELVRDVRTVFINNEEAIHDLSERLEAWVTGMAPDLSNGLFSDLLNHAIGMVDWRELAKAWIDDTD